MQKKEKVINIVWGLSGASVPLLILAIWDKSPLYWAIGFCLLMGAFVLYGGYMFFTDEAEYLENLFKSEEDEEPDTENPVEKYLNSNEVPDVMTNSEITAACIKAGITNPEDIKWVQAHSDSRIEMVFIVQHLLTQKKESK